MECEDFDFFFADIEARMLQVLDTEAAWKSPSAAAAAPAAAAPAAAAAAPAAATACLPSAHRSGAEIGATSNPREATDPKAVKTQLCGGQGQSPNTMPRAPLARSGVEEDTAEPTEDHGGMVQGPCFLKMLVPDYVAGAIIGKNGTTISGVERSSQCQVLLSSTGTYFPGTRERVLVAGGTMKGLESCSKLLFEQLFLPRGDREAMVKLVVPNSSVSAVIGSSGRTVRNLAQRTGCRINAAPRVPPLLERLVVLSGLREPLLRATLEVCQSVQSDPHLCEHLNVAYNVELPLGTWLGESKLPKDTGVVLVHPGDAEGCSKRELLHYLLRAAPRGLLLEQGIGGKADNVLKSKSARKLLDLVKATWCAREAKGPARAFFGDNSARDRSMSNQWRTQMRVSNE